MRIDKRNTNPKPVQAGVNLIHRHLNPTHSLLKLIHTLAGLDTYPKLLVIKLCSA
jgi:hypothetical protein